MPAAYNNERIAFQVGEDYARYGLSVPDDTDAGLVQGYRAGSAAGRPLESDRFVRKWLQVRLNAWKRNRFVDDAFTPEFLQRIDRPTCPVSGVEFTYARGAETDWPVDCIDNDGGYTLRKVMVVTTWVNQAKGDMSILEMLKQGHPMTDPAMLAAGLGCTPSPKLTSREWRKLAWFAATSDKCTDYPARQQSDMSPYNGTLPSSACCSLQRILIMLTTLSHAKRDAEWGDLEKRSLSAEGKTKLRELRHSVEQYARCTPANLRAVDEAFDDDIRRELFSRWWIWLARTGELRSLLVKLQQERRLARNIISVNEVCKAKQSATHGFA